MVQSPFAGATDYSAQTLSQLKKDLEKWISFSEEIAIEYQNALEKYSRGENKMWEKVPHNFKIWCKKIVETCKAFKSDFEFVSNCIEKGKILSTCSKRLNNIGKTSFNYCDLFKESFDSDERWKDYKSSDYFELEKLYCDGADYLITLWDASNMAPRLENFMEDKTEINVDNSIHIGDGNNLKKANIGSKNNNSTNINSETKKESFWSKFWWLFVIPLAVAIISGIVVAIILNQ